MNQQFNVLCVTKISANGGSIFHLPFPNEEGFDCTANLKPEKTKFGINYGRTMVEFLDRVFPIVHIRSGLHGTAVTIGISVEHDGEFHLWELYTDTPVSDRDSPGVIRLIALQEIKNAEQERLHCWRRGWPERGVAGVMPGYKSPLD